MKKILSLLTVFFLFLSAGCGKQSSDVVPITSGLKFTAEISCNDIVSAYNVTVSENGVTEMEIISDELNGLTVSFENSTVTFKYKELEYKTEISALPYNSYIDFLFTVFSSIGKDTEVLKSDNLYYINDSTPKYNYTVHFGESGLPIALTDGDKALSVTVQNATITA